MVSQLLLNLGNDVNEYRAEPLSIDILRLLWMFVEFVHEHYLQVCFTDFSREYKKWNNSH